MRRHGTPVFCRGALCAVLVLLPTLVLSPLVRARQADDVSGDASVDSLAAEPVTQLADRVDVLYFHRTIRCATCITFESYSHKALLADYADELKSGRVTWSVLNFEEEANAERVDRYDVFESSLVVSSVRDSVEVAWEKLEAIWGLVSDEEAFIQYVSAEVDTAQRMVADGGIEQGESAVPVHR